MTASKVVLCLLFDTFLVSTLPISFNLGVNGIGISNILSNVILLVVILILLNKEGVQLLSKRKLDFTWTKELFKVGGISGLESFVRNIAYMLMIVRMVNVVSEQGTYWVANNFIWGWLLLPISQLAELIKQDCATDETAIQNKTLGYFAITAIICVLWASSNILIVSNKYCFVLSKNLSAQKSLKLLYGKLKHPYVKFHRCLY